MLIYIIIFILISLYSIYPYSRKNSQQSKRIFLYLSFLTMALVLGLRGGSVGEDTRHYLNIFKHSSNVSWTDIFYSKGLRAEYYTNEFGYTDTIESGFLVVAKIIHIFTDNGQIFIFFISMLTCILFAKFIYDNCESVIFPTFIFLCESMFMLAFNGIRQILAAAITIQAYTLLKNKKWKTAVAIILIAALIHNVSLVSFVLFPIALIRPKKEFKAFKYAIVAATLSPFIVMLFQAVIVRIFPRYTGYFSTNYWTNSLGGIAIMWLLEFVLILVSYTKKFRIEDSFKVSCLVLIYLAYEFMGMEITMFSRVAWFFRPYLILFLPQCKYYFTRKTWNWIQGCIVILMMLLYLSYAGTSAREYLFYWE